MYKIKLFRNMSGLVAGQSMKQMITNRDWWKGVFGNMLSTMLGIALTVGVGALVEHHNDRKVAREMMFNVVRMADESIPAMEYIDSLNNVQRGSLLLLLGTYRHDHGDLTFFSDSILGVILDETTVTAKMLFTRSSTDKYFFSAQMMHQFKNPEKYSKFAEFVQFDAQTCDKIEKLRLESKEMLDIIETERWTKNATNRELIKTLIENKKIPLFYSHLVSSRISLDVKMYKKYFKSLLKTMGATEEEYEQYVKDNPADENSDEDEAAEKQTDQKQSKNKKK